MTYDYSSLLNKEQYAAVTTDSQYVRIIAGAGSGKTRVLTYRISYLVSEMHVDPTKILAIAFTNKVAKEMKERAGKLVPEHADILSVSTFHSFCARFLRIEHNAIGYPAGFTIFDDEDQEKLVKDIAVSFGLKKGDEIVKTALQYIRKKKTKGIYPDDINISYESFPQEKQCLKFYFEYEAKKASMFALDFDDLLLQTIYILQNEEFQGIRERWAFRYDHILIDEFQDTNDVQYKLLQLLLRPDTCVYVVGDPDQTIYTWRGANQNLIIRFDKAFPDAETVILNRNYRSTKNILAGANKLIANNKNRVPKDLYTDSSEGEKIQIVRKGSAEEEAAWVGSEISSLLRQGVEARDIAILYRSSYVTRPFESEMAQRRIPYRIFGGLRFYQRKEVKDLLAYFRLLLNELDNVAFDRIVNVPKRGIGEGTLEKIKAESQRYGMSEYEYIAHLGEFDSNISGKAATALCALVQKMESTKEKLNEAVETYSQTLRDFITDIGYYEFIAEDEALDEDRVANVNAVFDDINHFISDHPESGFDEYLQNVSLLSSQDDMNDGNYVSLMTIHVAKGLEFDNVFVIAMNDGTFPSARSQNESGREGMEEERRLAYVAMTRAKKKLCMTCNSGYSYVTDSRAMPSPFFKEAGLSFPSTGGYMAGPARGGIWKSINTSTSRFFDDGGHSDPFEKKEEPKRAPVTQGFNNVKNWQVGDIACHEKWGEGEVVEVISDSIIAVNFESVGKKTLMSNHKMLSRKVSKGGQA